MRIRMILLLTTAVPATLAASGCASTLTEETYGDSVRSVVAAQRLEPQPREPEVSTDGARMESVLSIYRTWVGDPLPVIKQRAVEGQ